MHRRRRLLTPPPRQKAVCGSGHATLGASYAIDAIFGAVDVVVLAVLNNEGGVAGGGEVGSGFFRGTVPDGGFEATKTANDANVADEEN